MITYFQMDFVQQNEGLRIGKMISTDALTVVDNAGYVDDYIKNANIALEATDFIAVSASNGNAWFYPSFGVDNSVTLVAM